MGADGMKRVQLFVGTKNGLFRFDADEDRRSWRLSGPFLPGWTISALHVPPRSNGQILAATCHLAYGPTIRESADHGETWRQFIGSPRYSESIEGGERYSVKQVWTIAAADEGQTYFAGVDDAGIFASADGGSTWREVPAFAKAFSALPHNRRSGVAVDSIAVDQGDPKRIWVSARRSGVFRSTDGGASFERCDAGLPDIVMLAQNPRRPDELYAQTAKGMYRTTDGGNTWNPDFAGLPSRFGFALHVASDGTAYTVPLESQTERHVKGGRLQVYRKVQDGANWEPLSAGLPEHPYYAGVLRSSLHTDDLDPHGVYFGTTAGEVFASSDAGATWQRLPGGFARITTLQARVIEA